MSALVASVAAYTVFGTLLLAGAGHLSTPAALPAALEAHGLLPARGLVAAATAAGEALTGGAGVVALVWGGHRPLLTLALAAAAVLLALMGAYAAYVLRTGRTGPCGCSRRPLPMSGWVVARAGILATLAVAALGTHDSVLPLRADGAPADLAVAVLAAATFTCLLWQLPVAMYDPTPAGVRR